MNWQVIEPNEVSAFAEDMRSWKAAVVDVETDGLDIRLGAKVRGIGLNDFYSEEYYYLPIQHLSPLQLRSILDPLERIRLINHNIKFDLHALTKLGWKGKQEAFYDVIVLARLWAQEEHPQLGLKELGEQIFGFQYPDSKIVASIKAGKIDELPIQDVAHYCCTDLWLTKKLYLWFKKKLPASLLHLFVKETELTKDLFDMENLGVYIDQEYVEEAAKLLDDEVAAIKQRMKEISGNQDFNPGSAPQKRILMEKFGIRPVKMAKEGASWDREALLKVRHKHPFALDMAKYGAMTYQRNGFIERALTHVRAGSPAMYGEFKNWGTVTGRLSGDLQQLPKGWLQFGDANTVGEEVLVWASNKEAKERNFSLRRIFKPRPGHVLIKADYNQIEMYVLGFYMQDRTFNRWLESGNVHRAVAIEIWGDGEKYYDRGKVYNFGTVYGQGNKRRAEALNCTEDEAKEYRRQYDQRMPGYRKLLRKIERLLERDGYIENVYGRRYHLDPDVAYRGVNYLCQGSAGDYVKFKLTDNREIVRQIGMSMLMTTHDDFIAEMPEENLSLVPEWLQALRPSPFGRNLEVEPEYSFDNLVELHPYPPIVEGAMSA